jgi:hypothetical protein
LVYSYACGSSRQAMAKAVVGEKGEVVWLVVMVITMKSVMRIR